jgi:hypothetical protein
MPDVVVEVGAVPRRLPAPAAGEDWWEAEPGRFLLRGGRRAGRFLVEGGLVTLERNPAAEDHILAQLFADVVLAAVLRQRGLLVLHANAALTPRGVVLIAGPSGIGKSTALAALLSRGYSMLADDLTAVRLAAGGHVEALPGVAQVHLTQAAAKRLGYPIGPGQLQPRRRMKAAVPTDQSIASAPGRVCAIYLLDTHAGSRLRVGSLSGAAKFDGLQQCIYGPMFAEEHQALFSLCAAVLAQVELYRIERPANRWSTDEVSDVVLASAGEGRR